MIIVDEDFLNPEEIAYMQKVMVEGSEFETRWVFDSDSQMGHDLSNENPQIVSDERFDGSPQVCLEGSFDGNIVNFNFDSYAKSLLGKFAIKHGVPIKEVLRTKSTVTFPKPDPRPDYAHVDYGTPGYVILIYVVDSDGDTVLYNEKFAGEKVSELTERLRITPKAGKAVLFDNYIWHAVYNPVNSKFRQIINMNFTAPTLEIK